MSQDTQSKIQSLIDDNRVVLFMKGTRAFPQCGFSARAVELLSVCGAGEFKDVNVLLDTDIRQGIKEFSNWPTIPQCYIDGAFVGNSDVLFEMVETGELQKLLGGEMDPLTKKAPEITLTKAAREAFAGAMIDAGDEVLRFEVSPDFVPELRLGSKQLGDHVVEQGALHIHVSTDSAARADGTQIDYLEGPEGLGFRIDNPNAPKEPKEISPYKLKAWLDEGEPLQLYDLRSAEERAQASLAQARPFDETARRELEHLPKDTRVVFFCHHGADSRRGAIQWMGDGYTNIHVLLGGIDTWSQQVDPSVPRY